MNLTTLYRIRHLGRHPIKDGLREYWVEHEVFKDWGFVNAWTKCLARDAIHAANQFETRAWTAVRRVKVVDTGEELSLRKLSWGSAQQWRLEEAA